MPICVMPFRILAICVMPFCFLTSCMIPETGCCPSSSVGCIHDLEHRIGLLLFSFGLMYVPWPWSVIGFLVPNIPRSFWLASRIATCGQVQRHSGFEWLCKHNRLRPEPIRFVIIAFEHAQSDAEFVNRGLAVLGQARDRDSWYWPKGVRPLGTRMSDRKIRTALKTNQTAGLVTVPSWENIYHINTNETPGELSRENWLIILHVEKTCYVTFACEKNRCCYGYIPNGAFRSESEMVSYFIGSCIINRTLHGHLETRNFSSHVQKYFARNTLQHLKRNFIFSRCHHPLFLRCYTYMT